ncbi:MAG: HesB/IscA family protein [Candidatus Zixiibacteriota bacterium]
MTEQTKSSQTDAVVTITPSAEEEILRLMAEQSDDATYLRLGVAAGGCSGMSYTMAFESEKTGTDHILTLGRLTVLLDPEHLPYLQGCAIDYKGALLGGGFQIDNPNARRSCGCGTSFTC